MTVKRNYDQKRIAESGTVRRVTVDHAGKVLAEDVPLTSLGSHDVRYIFHDGNIRSEEEQERLRRIALKAGKRTARTVRKVALDDERAAVIVGVNAVPITAILPLLTEFYGFDVEALIAKQGKTLRAVTSFENKIIE